VGGQRAPDEHRDDGGAGQLRQLGGDDELGGGGIGANIGRVVSFETDMPATPDSESSTISAPEFAVLPVTFLDVPKIGS
jgi:hypothetical protein